MRFKDYLLESAQTDLGSTVSQRLEAVLAGMGVTEVTWGFRPTASTAHDAAESLMFFLYLESAVREDEDVRHLICERALLLLKKEFDDVFTDVDATKYMDTEDKVTIKGTLR